MDSSFRKAVIMPDGTVLAVGNVYVFDLGYTQNEELRELREFSSGKITARVSSMSDEEVWIDASTLYNSHTFHIKLRSIKGVWAAHE